MRRAPKRSDTSCMGSPRTPATVGPGSYASTQTFALDEVKEKRLNANWTDSCTPGPGAYTDIKPTGDVSGGLGLRSTVERFSPTDPGAIYRTSAMATTLGPDALHGDAAAEPLRLCTPPVRPVVQQERSKPSIPMHKFLLSRLSNVFRGDGDSSPLVVRHTGETRDMVGPGEYSPDARSILSPGIPTAKLDSSDSRREMLELGTSIGRHEATPRDVPGPGAYGSSAEMELRKEASTSSFVSKTPMAHQINLQADSVGPGPGRYEHAGRFEKTIGPSRARKRVARAGWTRFLQPCIDSDSDDDVPGPGHYAGKRVAFPDESKAKKAADRVLSQPVQKRFPGVHNPRVLVAIRAQEAPSHGFTSSGIRPCLKPLEQTTPSPSEYIKEDCRGASLDATLREKLKIGRRGAFGSCASRESGSLFKKTKGRGELRGHVVGELCDSPAHETSSMFRSSSRRFDDLGGPMEKHVAKAQTLVTPAPGDYETIVEPNYRSRYYTPRRDHLAFGSSKTRFSDTMDSTGGAGPGEYLACLPTSSPRGFSLAKLTPRQDEILGHTPASIGPGSYLSAESNMLKRSFNVTKPAAIAWACS